MGTLSSLTQPLASRLRASRQIKALGLLPSRFTSRRAAGCMAPYINSLFDQLGSKGFTNKKTKHCTLQLLRPNFTKLPIYYLRIYLEVPWMLKHLMVSTALKSTIALPVAR
jgi:hypothetical protein